MYLQEFAKKIGKKPQIHSMLDSIKDKGSYRHLTLKRKQIIQMLMEISSKNTYPSNTEFKELLR